MREHACKGHLPNFREGDYILVAMKTFIATKYCAFVGAALAEYSSQQRPCSSKRRPLFTEHQICTCQSTKVLLNRFPVLSGYHETCALLRNENDSSAFNEASRMWQPTYSSGSLEKIVPKWRHTQTTQHLLEERTKYAQKSASAKLNSKMSGQGGQSIAFPLKRGTVTLH